MYRKNDGQTTIYDFIIPFGGYLKEDNHWEKLHNIIDWEIVDEDIAVTLRIKQPDKMRFRHPLRATLFHQRSLELNKRCKNDEEDPVKAPLSVGMYPAQS